MQLSTNIQAYWAVLKDLSNDDKRSLVALLLKSLKASVGKKEGRQSAKTPDGPDWVDAFYGSWNDTPETAEEL